MKGLGGRVPVWVLVVAIIATAAVATVSTVFLLQYIQGATPDFSIGASQDSMTILASPVSPWSTTTIAVRPMNSFTGIVALMVSAPMNVSAGLQSTGLNQVPVSQVTLGTQQNLTLTVSVAFPASYAVKVTGTSGRLSHSLTITVVARGLLIGTTPNQIKVPPSSSSNPQVTLTSTNGLSGNFTVDYAQYGPGWSVSGIPSYVVLTPLGTSSFTLAITTQSQWQGGRVDLAVYTPVGIAIFHIDVAV